MCLLECTVLLVALAKVAKLVVAMVVEPKVVEIVTVVVVTVKPKRYLAFSSSLHPCCTVVDPHQAEETRRK
jgi:hypothetical protein